MCANIKIVCNEAVTAKKVDDAALETFKMEPGAGGEDLNCVRGDVRGVHEGVHVRESRYAGVLVCC